ncbi:MAG: helix-turn-helix domain-containing protein [Candidatus Caenarcaniphilales bacterium]|nr:helix-turn-helix domain-containing protein [Candidatus Caenarcaniphilales bacterium]
MKKCPRCESERIWKSGFQGGKQRYKCRDCLYHFSSEKLKGFSDEIKAKAVQLYLEGLGFRAIGRFLGVSQVSVMNWVKAAGNVVQMKPPKKVEVVECDEMCITIGEKNIKFGCGSVYAVSADKSSGMSWVIVQRNPVEN